jgi:hypothetical protein
VNPGVIGVNAERLDIVTVFKIFELVIAELSSQQWYRAPKELRTYVEPPTTDTGVTPKGLSLRLGGSQPWYRAPEELRTYVEPPTTCAGVTPTGLDVLLVEEELPPLGGDDALGEPCSAPDDF